MRERFREVAGASDADFGATVRSLLLRASAERAARMRALLEQQDGSPAYWAQDVRAHLAVLEHSVATGAYFEPRDLRDRGLDAKRVARTLVMRFGELLRAWPAVLEAARILRERGEGLARPVFSTAA